MDDHIFERLAAGFLADPAVSTGTGFGASRGLRVGGRIFAIFGPGQLTVKVPRERVHAIVAEGGARPFDPGHGRLLKEWVTVSTDRMGEWEALAAEAKSFVEQAR